MKIILPLILLILISCRSKSSNSNEVERSKDVEVKSQQNNPDKLVLNDSVVYLSGANDSALIRLTLLPDDSFNFYMTIYPEPMQDIDTIHDVIKARGSWFGDNNSINLKFAPRENDTLNLEALFDPTYKNEDEFTVLDKFNVEIKYSLPVLTIWGIKCIKTEY